MNTITKIFFALTIGIASATNAQNIMPLQQSLQSVSTNSKTSSGAAQPEAVGDTIFSESFGNGFLGDGLNGAWTTNGTVSGVSDTAAVWEYRGASTTPNNSVGSRGAFSDTLGTIQSGTLSNGFMIFDSDYRDNGGVAANLGLGSAPSPHKSWLISPSFSTVGITNVSIRLSSYYYRYQGNGYLLLSNNGGISWTDTVTIFDDLFGIQSISNSNKIIDVAVNSIANSANAKIAFYFDGASSSSLTINGYYFFMIDDLLVYETPNNDLKLKQVYYQGYQNESYSRYYHQIPLNQASGDSINFAAAIYGFGLSTQTNSHLEVDVVNSGATVWSNNTDSVSIVHLNSDSVEMNPSNYFTPSNGIGLYNIEFNVVSDSIDDYYFDNIDSSDFEVSEYTYAWDSDSATTVNWFNSSSGYEIMLKYKVNVPDTVRAISVYIKDLPNGIGLPANSVVSYYLYSGTNLSTPLASHLYYIATGNEVNSWLTLPITATYVTPGDYYVGFRSYSDSTAFASNIEDNKGVAPYDVLVRLAPIYSNDPWLYLLNTRPYIRMIMNDTSLCSAFVENTSITICNGEDYVFSDGTVILNITSDTSYISTVLGAAPNGCDSVITENITVLPSFSSSINANVCTGTTYTFLDGNTMVISGNISHVSTLSAINGCDSLVTENITSVFAPSSTVSVHICYGGNFTYADGVTVNNVTTNQNHTSAFPLSTGCDSTITENLMVPFSSIVAQECKGSDFTFIDGTVSTNLQSTVSHTSTISGAGVNGCDSIVEETVYVNTVDVFVAQTGASLMANLSGASYQWYNCNTNTPIAGETNQIFTATANGDYKVEVNDGNCVDQSTCYTVTGLSVNEAKLKYGVNLYPNPTEDVLYIDLQRNIDLTIEITDNTGKVVYLQNAKNEITVVDMSQFSPGVYFVKLSNETGSQIEKIIKE